MEYLGRTATLAFPKTSIPDLEVYLDKKTTVHLCYRCSLAKCRQHSERGVKRTFVATAVHKDCFVIATQACPLAPRLVCERIWELALARSPWPVEAEPPRALSFASPCLISPQAVNRIAPIIGVPQLVNFPSELVERIRSYSPGNAPFWKAIAALTVASSLPDFATFPKQEVELQRILHWKRGGEIETVGPVGRHDVIRLTFDVDGIREIERFCKQPECEGWQKNNRRFAYAALLPTSNGDRRLSRRLAYCKNGLLRLTFDRTNIHRDSQPYSNPPGLPRIWDTPTPPDLGIFPNLYDHEDIDISTGHFINLDTITGLTFVYRGKDLAAIYPHHGDYVDMTYPKTSPSGSSKIPEACFFLPVTKEDTVLGIGVGSYQNAFVVVVCFCFPFSTFLPPRLPFHSPVYPGLHWHLSRACPYAMRLTVPWTFADTIILLQVKKRLSGDSVIGLPCPDPPEDDPDWEGPIEDEEDFFEKSEFLWDQVNPKALVFGFCGKTKYLNLLGGYRGPKPKKYEWEGFEGFIPHRWPRDLFCFDDEADLRYYTCAPLRGVVAAQMYFYPSHSKRSKQRICSGIIFHYDHGGSRVVGEIRLQDRAKLAGEMIINPKLICLESEILPGFDTPNIHFVTECDIQSEAHHGYTSWAPHECPKFPGVSMTCYPMKGTIDWWFTANKRNSIVIRAWTDDEGHDLDGWPGGPSALEALGDGASSSDTFASDLEP